MKNVQENKLSMYYAVQKVCSTGSPIWTGLPGFVTAFNGFELNIGKIKDAIEVQETKIKGVAEKKEQLEDKMIDKALEVAHAVFAYATDQEDLTLRGKMNFTRSEFKRTRDSIIIEKCRLIHDEANAVISSLASYGIISATLTDLTTRINNFVGYVAAPRTSITQRKGATMELVELFNECDLILKSKLDKLMEQFKTTQPKFYKHYFNARIIIDLGTRFEKEEETDDGPPKS